MTAGTVRRLAIGGIALAAAVGATQYLAARSFCAGVAAADAAASAGCRQGIRPFDARPSLDAASQRVLRVPTVAGLVQSDAARLVENIGLRYEVRAVGGPNDGLVLAQEPPPGSRIAAGGLVVLRARCVMEPCPGSP